MKRLFLIGFCFFFSASLHADIIEIPEAIKKTFEELFPKVKMVKWDNAEGNRFEAGFVLNGKDVVAVFMPDGTFTEIETPIQSNELPLRVLKSIQKKFPLCKVTYAMKIQRANDVIVYDLEVDTGAESLDITLDSYGFEVF